MQPKLCNASSSLLPTHATSTLLCSVRAMIEDLMGKRTEASAELYMLEEGDGDGDDDSSGDMSETASSNEAQVGCRRATLVLGMGERVKSHHCRDYSQMQELRTRMLKYSADISTLQQLHARLNASGPKRSGSSSVAGRRPKPKWSTSIANIKVAKHAISWLMDCVARTSGAFKEIETKEETIEQLQVLLSLPPFATASHTSNTRHMCRASLPHKLVSMQPSCAPMPCVLCKTTLTTSSACCLSWLPLAPQAVQHSSQQLHRHRHRHCPRHRLLTTASHSNRGLCRWMTALLLLQPPAARAQATRRWTCLRWRSWRSSCMPTVPALPSWRLSTTA